MTTFLCMYLWDSIRMWDPKTNWAVEVYMPFWRGGGGSGRVGLVAGGFKGEGNSHGGEKANVW